jgi:16S rRNA processing protein RimM
VSAPAFVVVGRVRKAHGIRGELVVESITDDPATHFAAGKRLLAGDPAGALAPADFPGPRALTIRRAVPFKGGWILRVEEITDRTAADEWRARYLLVPGTDVTPPREDQIYYHELVGLRVERGDGAELGEVEALYEVPQGLVLDVRTPRGLVMLPYRPEVVTSVDVGRRALVVNPPAGLFED